jgi:hypothetical protein
MVGKRVFFVLFFYCVQSFSQEFDIQEVQKVVDFSGYTVITDIDINREGSLIYSISGHLVEHIGDYKKLHKIDDAFSSDFPYIRITSGFANKVYFSRHRQMILSKNTVTGQLDSLATYRGYNNSKNAHILDFTVDTNEDVWFVNSHGEVRQMRNQEVIRVSKISDFSNSRAKPIGNLKIVKHQEAQFLIFAGSIYAFDVKSNRFFKVFQCKQSQGTLPLVVSKITSTKTKKADDSSFDYQNYNYLHYKETIHFVEVPATEMVDVSRGNYRIRSEKIDLIVAQDTNLVFYTFRIDKQGEFHLTPIDQLQLPAKILYLAVHNNIIYIMDILNRIFKINNLASKFTTYEFLPNSPTRGLTMDSHNNIYVIPEDNNTRVVKIDVNDQREVIIDTQKLTNFIDARLQDIILENDSILWITGMRHNLIRHQLNSGITDYWKIPNPSFGTYSMVSFKEDKLLFRASSRIVSFDKKKEQFEDFCDFKGNGTSYKIDYQDGKIWCSKGDSLLYYDFSAEVWRTYIAEPNCSIYDFHFDKFNRLLLGTVCGLLVLDKEGNLIKHFTIKEGLPDNRVVSIEETNTDYWLGTFNGLTRMNKKTSKFFNYYKKDGLTHNEFNRGSSFYHSDSLLLFGGMNGFVKFDPRQITQADSYQPKLINVSYYHKKDKKVKDLQYNLDEFREVNLPFDRNFISFVFAGQTDEILYSIDNSEWILADLGKVNLPGLDGGEHVLKVRSKINPSMPLTYRIQVNEVFYKKVWVQFAFFNLLLIILLMSYLVTKRRRAKEKIRLLKVRELEDAALRNQMNPHFLFNGINNIQSILLLKGEKFVNKYIYSLTNLLRFNLESSGNKKILLKDEIDYLKSYVQLEHLRRDERFEYEFLISEELSLKEIWIPPMLFQPIVENAIKHGLLPMKNDGFLRIEFKKVGQYLMGAVSDNGAGITATKKQQKNKIYRSYGNKILNKRIDIYNQIHQGYIEYSVASESNGMGTSVCLKILLLE